MGVGNEVREVTGEAGQALASTPSEGATLQAF